MRSAIGSFIIIVAVAACSDSAGPKDAPVRATAGNAAFDSGAELRVPVPESGRVFVNLASSKVGPEATDWDLAFEGHDVFTNSGPSGDGGAGVFGPLDASAFSGDEAPEIPFLALDKTAGAFADWYAYDGEAHLVWSRYHDVAIKEGPRLWKLQILGYYGVRNGAPVSGLYRVRYAELIDGGSGPTRELTNLDATAGGPEAPATAPSACVDLETGDTEMLTPAAARTSRAWHVCFRRQTITVNGEAGGPRGVGAIDLDTADTAAETLDALKKRTADTEATRFESVTRATCEGKSFRGDRVVSGFGDGWIDRTKSPLTPAQAVWVVSASRAKQKYFVAFTAFERATASSPGVVVMRVKPVKG